MSARDRTKWMSLAGLKAHFIMHALQADLLDIGLGRLGIEGGAFILMHTGAALRPDGAGARGEVIEAIEEKVRQHEAEAQAAQSQADKWKDIRKRIVGMGAEDAWRNPLWEREMIKVFRKEIREMEAAPPSRSAMKLFDQKFRRTFTYHDVVCIYQGEFAAFKVDPTEMDMMHAAPTEWIELFPEIEFKRTGFRWMAFPKDLSRGTSIAYLQFGNMAGRLAGNGHTRRYNFEENRWVQGDSIESWVS